MSTIRRAAVIGVWAAAAMFRGPMAGAVEMREQLTNDAIPGWEVKEGQPEAWVVRDGILSCTGKGGGWIGTKTPYADFVIELEYKVPVGGNSGVFLRAPNGSKPGTMGMEVQILDDDAAKYRNIQPWQHCGSLYHIAPATKRAYKPAGEWNHLRVTADRDHILVELNGQTVVDTDGAEHPEILAKPARGALGLQNHGTGVWFRHIRMADLTADRARRTQWFREAKFGLFIHWGVYALIGEGEWIMNVRKIPAAEYEQLPPKFNPQAFNAAEWVGLAKRAGQKYVVISSKHHDGFAMYDSKVSDYDIIDATPYKHDPMKDLADECRKHGLKFGFYYSILDWHHRDYSPVPEWDKQARAGHTPGFDRYLEYMQAQVRELCKNYGPLACIWWDGGWDHQTPQDKAEFARVNAMVRQLQPDILINNRANVPEDFDTPEQFIPPTGLNNADGSPKLWENCITLTTGHGAHPPTAWWGYDKNETQFKTPEFCIRMLIDVVSKGGNLLLNVGPTPEGRIRPEEAKVLEAIGEWLKVNGEAIYDTTASPFKYLPFFGRATVKANTLYLHVFDWPAEHQLRLPGVKNTARSARLLASAGATLEVKPSGSDLVIQLPDKAPDAVASVVAVELDGPPVVEPFTIRPEADGTLTLPVLYAELRGQHGQRARYETAEGKVHLANWTNAHDYLAWQFDAGQGGAFEIVLTYAADQNSQGGRFRVAVGQAAQTRKMQVGGGTTLVDEVGGDLFENAPESARIDAAVKPTGGPTTFAMTTVGRLDLPVGTCVLIVKALELPKDAPLMNLREVTLKPAR